MNTRPVTIIPIIEIPLIKPGDDLVGIILNGLNSSAITLVDGDILIITQKIVSKAEGAIVEIDYCRPSHEAQQIANSCHKDVRIIELILRESKKILRQRQDLFITEHNNGYICANAGIDYSNVEGDCVTLLPKNPDQTASRIRARIKKLLNVNIAVIITDSQGRPFRKGIVGVALGSSGISALVNKKGSKDLFGYRLKHTEIALIDELASAALLLMGETDEGIPVVVIRGLNYPKRSGKAKNLIRAEKDDLFR